MMHDVKMGDVEFRLIKQGLNRYEVRNPKIEYKTHDVLRFLECDKVGNYTGEYILAKIKWIETHYYGGNQIVHVMCVAVLDCDVDDVDRLKPKESGAGSCMDELLTTAYLALVRNLPKSWTNEETRRYLDITLRNIRRSDFDSGTIGLAKTFNRPPTPCPNLDRDIKAKLAILLAFEYRSRLHYSDYLQAMPSVEKAINGMQLDDYLDNFVEWALELGDK